MTPLLAATATADGDPPWRTLATVVALAVLAYVVSCWWFPFARCWCCHGTGRHARKDGHVFRNCRWCRGSGRRLRIGRRVWNYFTRVRRDAS